MKYVIFAPDDQSPLGLSILKGMFLANDPVGNLLPLVGCYKGESEWSFICNVTDFENIVLPNGFVNNQESILRVSECNKKYAQLQFHDGRTESIGSLKSVDWEEAQKHDSWTYRPDMDVFWVAVDGNPDTVHDPLSDHLKEQQYLENQVSDDPDLLTVLQLWYEDGLQEDWWVGNWNVWIDGGSDGTDQEYFTVSYYPFGIDKSWVTVLHVPHNDQIGNLLGLLILTVTDKL